MKKLLVGGAFLLLIAGCGGQTVTAEEYDQIKNGMTLDQVNQIIGAPGTKQNENTIAGIGKAEGYTWENKDGSNAVIVFLDGKVQMKAQRQIKETSGIN